MPEAGAAHSGEDKESKSTPKTNGEVKPEKKAQDRAQKEEKGQRARELQKELKEARGSTKKTREQAGAPAEGKKIPFKDAADIAEIAERVGKKVGVVVHPHEITTFRRVLLEFGGYRAEAVAKMDNADIIVAAYEVLRTAPIDKAKDRDFKIADKKGREDEIARLGELMRAAETAGEGLLRDEVEKYVTVEEFDYGESEESGPGAMAVANPLQEVSFKQLLQSRLDNFYEFDVPNPTPPPALLHIVSNQAVVDTEINLGVQNIDPDQPQTILRGLAALKDFNELISTREHDPALVGQLNGLVIGGIAMPALEQQLRDAKEALDQRYNFELDPLTEGGRNNLLRDLDDYGETLLNMLRYGSGGIHTFDDVLRELEARVLDRVVSRQHPEPPGLEGVRIWYAFKVAERTQEAWEIIQRSEVRPDPFRNIRNAYETMSFFETSRSVENFGLAADRINRLLQAVEQSPDPDLTPEMKFRFREHVEAFLKVTPVFIMMYRSEGNPEALQQYIEAIDDKTFFYYFDRFADTKDRNGVSYLRYVGASGHEQTANLLSEAKNSFLYQYMVDRYRVNVVQNLTRGNLNPASANPDEQWLIARLAASRLNWDDDSAKLRVINEWYKEQTLTGVDEYEPNYTQERRLFREDEVVHNILRQRLIQLGVPVVRVNALLGELRNPNADYDPHEFINNDPAQGVNPNFNPSKNFRASPTETRLSTFLAGCI